MIKYLLGSALTLALPFALPSAGHADVLGSAYLDSSASTNAVIGFSHGAADVTFSVPSPLNGACAGSFTGDTLCFASGDSDVDTLQDFLTSGDATVLSGSSAALGHTLDNTVLEFTGAVTVTNGELFQAGHDDGLQLEIGGIMVIDAPGPSAFTTTPATYTGPSGTFSFDLVYGECCGGPADLGISLPLVSPPLPPPTVPEPTSFAILGSALSGFGLLRRKRAAADAR